MPKKIVLNGRVQGVMCRNYCRYYARKMGIRGSASNMRDGTVLVLLDTSDDLTLQRYLSSLLNNPDTFFFPGRITESTCSEYDGPLDGDYNF